MITAWCCFPGDPMKVSTVTVVHSGAARLSQHIMSPFTGMCVHKLMQRMLPLPDPPAWGGRVPWSLVAITCMVYSTIHLIR